MSHVLVIIFEIYEGLELLGYWRIIISQYYFFSPCDFISQSMILYLTISVTLSQYDFISECKFRSKNCD